MAQELFADGANAVHENRSLVNDAVCAPLVAASCQERRITWCRRIATSTDSGRSS
jgi:hypothetical protein